MALDSEFTSLLAGLKRTDPRLHQALTILGNRVRDVEGELFPLIHQALEGGGEGTTDIIEAPLNFTITSTGATLRLTWSEVVGAFQYEIRKGTVWASASFITRTTGLRADLDPVLYGDHTYLIKSMTISGAYSLSTSTASITVSQIPAVSISSTVIDNNVLLYWTTPVSTFTIRHYIIKREGAQIGLSTGTFTTIFEPIPDTYTYGIIPVDVAGNVGTEATVDIVVTQPPDYELQDTRVSTLNGTKVDTFLEGTHLVVSWESESWQDHFDTRSWASIAAKIAAGYTLFIQPTSTTGSYEEVIDYGTVISNIIVTITYNLTQIAGSTTVVVKMAVSPDNITYSSFVSGAVQFYASFRYLKLKLEFTGADDLSLAHLFNLTTNLSVKRENDGGEVDALSTDATGTVVTFNKAFKDVESITLTVKETTTAHVAIYDFVDIPNPVSFKVYVYTLAGVRASKTVSWKARGII